MKAQPQTDHDFLIRKSEYTLCSRIILILAMLIFGNISFTLGQSNSYFPINIGYKWSYYDGYRTINEEIIDTARINNILYYGMGVGSVPSIVSYELRNDDSRVIMFNPIDSSDFILFDFSAEINESWNIPSGWSSCEFGNEVKLISKTDTVITPLDTFYNCFHFIHLDNSCWDAGRLDTWIAPFVGKVKYREVTFFGIIEGLLSDYSLLTSSNPELIISNDKIGVIFQNYPNPFNSTTTIPYYLSNPGKVSLIFYSINGQEIYSALNTFHKEGNYIYFFNPGIFPEGIYFCRLKINNQTVGFQKLIYLK